jgi:hypothetical protein
LSQLSQEHEVGVKWNGLDRGAVSAEALEASLDPFRLALGFRQVIAHLGFQLGVRLKAARLFLQDLDRLLFRRVQQSSAGQSGTERDGRVWTCQCHLYRRGRKARG